MMLETLLEHPLTLRLGWSLVHSLWQGALLAGLLGLGLALINTERNRLRHTFASAILLVWLAVPPATFLALAPQPDGSAAGPIAASTAPAVAPSVPSDAPLGTNPAVVTVERATLDRVTWTITSDQLRRVLPYAALVWVAVAALLTLRLLGGLLTAHHLGRTGTPMPQLEHRMRLLAARLDVRRRVRLRSSIRVDAPTALGWLKPVILLPTSTLAGLTPQQLELILAHELAHVRRHDYLVSVLQGVAEALLFFHPLTWLLSRALRIEREHACDALALQATGAAPLELAEALTRLEGARAAPAPALAATGNLAERVRRLLHATRPTPTRAPALLPLLVLVPLGLWMALAAAPPASAESLFERHHGGNLTGIYFEAPRGGWGQVMALDVLLAQATYPVYAATHLPEGYHFDNATWTRSAQTATLTYIGAGGRAIGSRDSHHVTVLQAPTGEFWPLPIGEDADIEPVAIGSVTGGYVMGNWATERSSPPADQSRRWEPNAGQMLAWQQNGMVFALGTDAPASFSGGGIGRDDLIRVANGLVAIHAAPHSPVDNVRLPNDKTRTWVTIYGDVTFAPDLEALARIGEGGSITVEERNLEGSRRVIVTANPDGELEFHYRSNGGPAAFEEEQHIWYEATMAELVFAPLRHLNIDPHASNYTIFNQRPNQYASTIGVPDTGSHPVINSSTRQLTSVLEQLTHATAHGLISPVLLEVTLHQHLIHADANADEVASFHHATGFLDSAARQRLSAARQHLYEHLQDQNEGASP